MRTLLTAMALVLVLVVSQAFAGDGNTKFGLKGGLSISNFHGDDADGWDSRAAFCVGAFTNIPINSMLSFQPELLYAMKGAKTTAGNLDLTSKISYVEIPMLFKVMVPMAGAVKPHVVVGPEVAFKTSSTLEGEMGGQPIEGKLKNIKNSDLGLIVGGGISFPLRNGMACVEARYDLGLVNVIDEEDTDIKNNTISIIVGFTL